jgi:elongation factor G
MGAISSEDIRNVVVLGHKGAGKTSLLAALRKAAGDKPETRGLDESPEEKEHGGTMETRVVRLGWRGKVINVLDTPGEPSFLADTLFAVAAADAAIIVVSGREGIQTGTERFFDHVHANKTPCLAVITKIDEEAAHVEELAKEIHERLNAPVVVMDGNHDQLASEVAITDEVLTDQYLSEGGLSQADLDDGLRRAVEATSLLPVFAESATDGRGIDALLDALVDLVPPPTHHPAWHGRPRSRVPNAGDPTAVFVFKTRIDPHAGRQSYVRVLSGELHADGVLVNAESGASERVTHLLQPNGKGAGAIGVATAGDIVLLGKLKAARTGDTLSEESRPFILDRPPIPSPLYARALVVEGNHGASNGAVDKAILVLQRLIEEDPGLSFGRDEATRELVVSGTSPLHLEIAVERLRRRSGIACQLGPPKVAYKETITRRVAHVEGKQKKQTGGHGQYAVCVIDVEPLERGGGFAFEDATVGGSVPRQFVPSVEKGMKRALARGVLAGYPVVDVKVRLVDGKAHAVDSSDAAFQVAGYRAFLAAAKVAHPAILEPIAKIRITIPEDAMGDVLGDLNSRHAKVLSSDVEGGRRVLTAYLTLAATKDYEPSLKRMTRGRGVFTVALDHYDFATPHVQEKLVRESAFKPAEDD